MGMPIVVYFHLVSFVYSKSRLATHVDGQVEQVEGTWIGLVVIGFHG